MKSRLEGRLRDVDLLIMRELTGGTPFDGAALHPLLAPLSREERARYQDLPHRLPSSFRTPCTCIRRSRSHEYVV